MKDRKSDSSDELVIDGPIEGAGEFHGRPDGKTSGRGMLGLISAIPPAPKLPTVKGVRMLAPTIPSERPSRMEPSDRAPTPMGLPDEEHGRDAEGSPAKQPSSDSFGEANIAGSDSVPHAQPAGADSAEDTEDGDDDRPAWLRFTTLLLLAIAVASIPVVHSALTQ